MESWHAVLSSIDGKGFSFKPAIVGKGVFNLACSMCPRREAYICLNAKSLELWPTCSRSLWSVETHGQQAFVPETEQSLWIAVMTLSVPVIGTNATMALNHLRTLPRHLSVNETVRAMDAAARASTATTVDTLQAGSCPVRVC